MDPKDINQTNFCNKKVDNIVSNDIKKYSIDDNNPPHQLCDPVFVVHVQYDCL